MASGYEMRVGDAEREATAAELREHYASGRLTLDELNERLDKALAAKTRGDLDALMRDLPSARPRAGAPGDAAGAGWTGAGSGWTGPGSGWTGPGSGWTGAGSGWTGPGAGWTGPGAGWGAGRQACGTVGSIITTSFLICVLLTVGILGAFGVGIGTGRPFGIALIILALGLLRRLIFRRRRRVVHGGGPRRRRW
jgi:hypothetical protein